MTFIPYQEINYTLVAPQTNYVLDLSPESYGTHCTFRYQISSSVAGNRRGGLISWIEDPATNAYDSSQSVLATLGVTTDFVFTVDVNSNNIRLLCTIAGVATWTVQLIKQIM